jgi:type IV secretion system protein VirB1
MPLDLATVLALAQACAPSVAPATLASVAHVESGFNPLVIGVNTPQHERRLTPASREAAISTAERLIARGDSVDLGLAQINATNLVWLGLSVADTFDPCRNLAGAAQVLQASYDRAAPAFGAEQAALRTALSYYNTGDPGRGFRNGYVAKVVVAAGRIVPAIRPDSAAPATAPAAPAARQAPEPPRWDVFARVVAPTAGFVFTPSKRDDAR